MRDYDPDAELAARNWLALADAGDAPGSWAAAASQFRNVVPEHKRAATEIVSPMRDHDGQWRVSGYYVR